MTVCCSIIELSILCSNLSDSLLSCSLWSHCSLVFSVLELPLAGASWVHSWLPSPSAHQHNSTEVESLISIITLYHTHLSTLPSVIIKVHWDPMHSSIALLQEQVFVISLPHNQKVDFSRRNWYHGLYSLITKMLLNVYRLRIVIFSLYRFWYNLQCMLLYNIVYVSLILFSILNHIKCILMQIKFSKFFCSCLFLVCLKSWLTDL